MWSPVRRVVVTFRTGDDVDVGVATFVVATIVIMTSLIVRSLQNPTYVFDRSNDIVSRNGKPLFKLTELQRVEVADTFRGINFYGCERLTAVIEFL